MYDDHKMKSAINRKVDENRHNFDWKSFDIDKFLNDAKKVGDIIEKRDAGKYVPEGK